MNARLDACMIPSFRRESLVALLLVASLGLSAPVHANGPLSPLAPSTARGRQGHDSDALVALGRRLFHDRALSGDGRYACIDCHDLKKGGSNGQRVGRPGSVHNVPSIFNLRYRTSFYRNGRASSLEEQAVMAIENPEEMDSDWTRVLNHVKSSPAYRTLIQSINKGVVDSSTLSRALAAYERTLETPDSPLDRYLRGDHAALTARQKAGYRLFLSAGCTACHQGRNIGANSFQKLGIISDYEGQERPKPVTDSYPEQDRMKTTGRPEDKDRFLVPSLRNVTRTAPYLHDGSVDNLRDVVRLMFQYQLGREVGGKELESLLAFLGALEGRLPSEAGVPQ